MMMLIMITAVHKNFILTRRQTKVDINTSRHHKLEGEQNLGKVLMNHFCISIQHKRKVEFQPAAKFEFSLKISEIQLYREEFFTSIFVMK